jgi:hypothetical protein
MIHFDWDPSAKPDAQGTDMLLSEPHFLSA